MRRRTVVTFTTAVLVASLAACSGGSGGSGSAGASGSGGGSKPSQSSAPKVVNALSIIERASSSTSSLKSAHISSTSEIGGKSTTMEGDVRYHPTEMSLTVSVAGQSLHEVLAGKTLYLKLPASAGVPGGKAWMSMSLTQMAKLTGLSLDSLLNSSSADQSVQLLRASQDLKVVGQETVDGVSTQHLRGTVDVQKALDALTTKGATAQKQSLSSIVKSLGMKDAHVDLWVNAQNVPIKMHETYTSSLGAGETTMHITKINQPVSIKAPAASQVQPFPSK